MHAKQPKTTLGQCIRRPDPESRESHFGGDTRFTSELRKQIAEISVSLSKASPKSRYWVIDEWHNRNQSDIIKLSGTFSGLAREDEHTRTVGLVLHSLNFPQLKERHSRIIEAHRANFDWVLKRDLSRGVPWANFVKYLTSGGGTKSVYWMNGKAGSGKSTLMRY